MGYTLVLGLLDHVNRETLVALDLDIILRRLGGIDSIAGFTFMELRVYGEPVTRVPFAMHGTKIHTICSTDEEGNLRVKTVEW